jgi:3-oxoacyl-[acyl-carrier-protein] synthase III
MNNNNNIIESLGVYLPSRIVSTEQVIKGCLRRIIFPLQQMTGITSRHMVADDEFSIDLAINAITRCRY